MKKENFRVYTVMLAILTLLIYFLSFYKLARYFIYHDKDNNEWSVSADSPVETFCLAHFPLRYQFVNLNGLLENIMGHQEMNGVVKMNNGYLMTTIDYVSDDMIEQNAEHLYDFKQSLDELGIQYLYVTVPYVCDKYVDNMMPEGIEDYGNDNLDRMRLAVEGTGIESLDLRDEIAEDGYTTYDLFYKTDHHWTTYGGFYAYTKIAEYLENTGNFEIDETIKDINNYTVTTYPQWHLGSRGQRTGIFYAGIDDFDLILPNFETYIYNWDYSEEGTYSDMIISTSALENRDYTSRYTYDSVYWNSLQNFHNPNASVDKTVLVVGDSMARTVMPYLCLSFTNVLFYEDNYPTDEINREYINEYKPDIIISMYYPDKIDTTEVDAYTFGLY